VACRMPDGLVRAWGSLLGLMFYVVDGPHRRVTLANLEQCFPKRPAGERRAIARATFAHFGQVLLKLRGGDATIYIEVTRGAAPRAHAFPSPEVAPTVYVLAKPFKNHPEKYWTDGVSALTMPDTRWSRCDIKSIALLPNVLANQQAHEAGAFEALFVRDGVLIEGSHSNLWGVIDGTAVTYQSCGYILGGITRKLLLERAHEAGVKAREAPIRVDELPNVQELFLSGTTTEVMPIVKVDQQTIGDGRPGPVTRKLQEAFKQWRRT